MSKKTAYWIFVLGTLSSLIILLALTFDFHRQVKALTHAENLSPQVLAGKWAWEKYNCNDCHTILGFGGYYGPDMTKAYLRIGETGIRYAVEKPEQAFATSFRKMPKMNLKLEEVENLIAFLKWTSQIDTHDWPPQDRKFQLSSEARRLVAGAGVSVGAALFKDKGCFNCHSLGGVGGTVGPSLDKVGARLDMESIAKYIEDPIKINPKADMPKLDLSPEEIKSLSEFLVNQK
jgi:nitric oxide reductase subunit C